jgi:2-succinyl-6-hydroxy-2,4-cyclohexadiene-1-carboxylate synthase
MTTTGASDTSARSASPEPAGRPSLASQRFAARHRDRGRLVAVHGFTQTSACWSPIDTALAPDHDLVLVDAPGHGASARVELDLWGGADALVATGGPGTYLGYSMGARLCLHAALAHPATVQRLVLISGTAGIDEATERAERRSADEALARHVEAVGVEVFIDEWLARPLFAGLSVEAGHRRARLANTAAGLGSSLRLAGTGTQEPLWDRLDELGQPGMAVLVVAGARDPKFVALAERLVAGIGANAELAVIEGAGHTVQLEQPDAFLAVLRPWLAATA